MAIHLEAKGMKALFWIAIDIVMGLIFVTKIWLERQQDLKNRFYGTKPDALDYTHAFIFWPIYLIIDIFRLYISLKQKLTRNNE